jgi:hypothetical protein
MSHVYLPQGIGKIQMNQIESSRRIKNILAVKAWLNGSKVAFESP